jgi:hypothetical protein
MNKWPAAYLLAALLSTPGVASAYVLQQCGEPLSRQIISGSVGADSPVVEQWVYDFGRRQPLRVLTFSGGRLQRIEDAGRSR